MLSLFKNLRSDFAVRPALALASLLLSFAFLPSAAHANRTEYSEFEPAPSGSLRVSRPTVAWKIIPHGGAQVTAVELELNGKSVTATYEAARQAVWYTPQTALAAGSYAVHCKVVIDNEVPVEKDWKFSVSRDASPLLSGPTTSQKAVCDEINAVRRNMNLPLLTVDNRLCAAAAGHCAYLAQTNQASHHQTSSNSGFVGTTAGERVGTFGYAGGCYESISAGVATPTGAVRGLFDAPYHRAPFLQPGVFDMGAGVDGKFVTLLFGTSAASGIVTYPADGQKNVPVTWDGFETPNPLRVHAGARGPMGYAITLFSFSNDETRLLVKSATLTGTDGKPVAIYLNTPQNDDFLQNGVLVIPQKPLRPGVTYHVSVNVSDEAGHDLTRSWSFTTAASQLAKK